MGGTKKNQKRYELVGKDEMNLAEFPFAVLAKYPPNGNKTIEIEREYRDDKTGKRHKQIWIVTGSDKWGLPTSYDNDVYVALMVLAREQGLKSPTIYFSRHELLQLMQRGASRRDYQRLKESLHRIQGVTIHADNAFYDHIRRHYRSEAFGLIESFVIEDERPNTQDERQQHLFSYTNCSQKDLSTHVVFNKVLWRSVAQGYIKNLDAKFYFSLTKPTTKRLYRHLDKKAYHGPRYTVGVMTLAEKMPVSGDYPSKVKERLKKAHGELIEKGYLDQVVYSRSGKTHLVTYHFSAAALAGTALADQPELVQALVKRGVTLEVAINLYATHSKQDLQSQLEVFDWRMKQTDEHRPKNPGGYLRKAIEDRYQPPGGYLEYKKQERYREEWEARRAAQEEERARKRKEDEGRHQAFEALWDALAEEERKEVLADLNEALDPFHRQRVLTALAALEEAEAPAADNMGPLSYHAYREARNTLLAERYPDRGLPE